MGIRTKLHNAKWIGAEQIRQILTAVGVPIGDSGAGIDASSITSGTISADRLPSYVEATTTLVSSSGVVTIDLSADIKRYEFPLTENVTGWVFINPPASGLYKEIIITPIQHATAPKTVVSPATTGRTAGGIAWVADTTLSSREALVLHCFSDSTRTLFPTGRQV